MKLQRCNKINGIRKGILAHECQLTLTAQQEQDNYGSKIKKSGAVQMFF
jgi:hypothetical protein